MLWTSTLAANEGRNCVSICLQWLCVKLSTGGREEVVGINTAANEYLI